MPRSSPTTGIPLPAATLAIVLITREHSRPESELLHIVRQYQGLEEPWAAAEAVADLKRRGWLEGFQTYGVTLLRQDPEPLKMVAKELHESGIFHSPTSFSMSFLPRKPRTFSHAGFLLNHSSRLPGANSRTGAPAFQGGRPVAQQVLQPNQPHFGQVSFGLGSVVPTDQLGLRRRRCHSDA